MSERPFSAQSGFSLLEALIAMILMGLVLAALSSITAHWLPNWKIGFISVQNQEILQRGLERILADLSAPEYIPFKGGSAQPLFAGTETSVTFVRPSLGPNAGPGLEIVHIEQKTIRNESILVRTHARFAPAARDISDSLPQLGDPVVVLRTPYRLTFSYAGDDRLWHTTWQNAPQLPRAIRLTIQDTNTGRTLSESTVAMVHVTAPPALTTIARQGAHDKTIIQSQQ